MHFKSRIAAKKEDDDHRVSRTFFSGVHMHLLVCLFVVLNFCATAQGLAQSEEKKLLHAALKNKKGQVTRTFRDDVAKISAYWRGESLKAGDRVRAIWIAENVGYGEHPDTQITQSSVIVVYKPDEEGIFSLAKPIGGWPVGDYRVEIYVGDILAEKLKFKIESGPEVEVQ